MHRSSILPSSGVSDPGQERLAKNVPRTIDNTRIYDSSSYLTADPASLRAAAEKAADASRAVNGGAGEDDLDEDDEVDEDDDMEETDEESDEDGNDDESQAGPSRPRSRKGAQTEASVPGDEGEHDRNGGPFDGDDISESVPLPIPAASAPQVSGPPPRIMITTSPSPCKETYAFCEDLRGIFPGGEFFKRPRGKGFEIGRVARWAAKRGYNAICVVNEDHKIASGSSSSLCSVSPDH